MFWRVSGLSAQASPVDSILDKESYSLEELLDEDELIQECKSLNARLTAYLKQKETVEKLVRYLVEPPPADADPKRAFKYPFTACEIFCCEVEGIFNTLLEHEELLGCLFSLLQSPRPLNSMLAGYFSRVMGSLLLRRTQDVMQYLQKHQHLLQQLVDHVDTTSVAEVLVRLVGADEQRAFLSTNHLQWLSETNLLYQLLEKLQPGQPFEAQSNAAEILAALAQSQVSPLTRNLAEPAFLELLVERALRQPAAAPGKAETAAVSAPASAGDSGNDIRATADGSSAPEEQKEAPVAAAAVNGDGGEGPRAEGAVPEGEGAAPADGGGTAAEVDAAEGGVSTSAADSSQPAPSSSTTSATGDSNIDTSSPSTTVSSSSSSAMMHALNVCIALVEPLPPSPAEQQAAAAQGLGVGGMPAPAIDAAAVELHAAMRAQATRCIAKSIHRLVALLEAVDPDRQLPTSYGLLHPPVGLARLKAVELLAALLHSGEEIAESAVMGTEGVQRSMELFLQFPFNNVLHRHVAALVTSLDSSSEALADFLLGECRLLSWLVEAPQEVMPPLPPGDEDTQKRKALRAGYAGHVTQISNRLIQLANEGHKQLRAAMEGDAGWQAYVKERLEPRNAQENVYAWKCGRPTVHEPVAESEADMFQTELDFGVGEGEAFTRDVYQRYGVFASHEDEEVDPEQPQWAMELASAAGTAAGAAAGPGKLPPPMPPSVGPQPFPLYDSSSSSSSDEEGEVGNLAPGSRSESEEGEVSVTPAPEGDGDMLLVNSSGGSGGPGGTFLAGSADVVPPPRPPLGSDDADMADDAVMLEYDAAEQLVSLSMTQLSLEDGSSGSGGNCVSGVDGGDNASAATVAGGQPTDAGAAAAAAATSEGAVASEAEAREEQEPEAAAPPAVEEAAGEHTPDAAEADAGEAGAPVTHGDPLTAEEQQEQEEEQHKKHKQPDAGSELAAGGKTSSQHPASVPLSAVGS